MSCFLVAQIGKTTLHDHHLCVCVPSLVNVFQLNRCTVVFHLDFHLTYAKFMAVQHARPENLHTSLYSFSQWWFKYFLFSPLPGEMIQFDSYFSDGLKPPSSFFWSKNHEHLQVQILNLKNGQVRGPWVSWILLLLILTPGEPRAP